MNELERYEYYVSLLPSGETLEHYGIKRKSGRYPYGSGLRPFQRDPIKGMKRKEAEKYSKQYDEYLSKLREAAKTNEKAAAELKARIDSAKKGGSITELLRFQQDMTYQELSDAYNRVQLVAKISEASSKDTSAIWNVLKKASQNGKTITDVIKTLGGGVMETNKLIAALSGSTDFAAYEQNRIKLRNKAMADAMAKASGKKK